MNTMFAAHLDSIIAESKLVFPAPLFFKPENVSRKDNIHGLHQSIKENQK